MTLLREIKNAFTLAPQALYALYFDVMKADPGKLAAMARHSIRTVFFSMHGDHRLTVVSLQSWLSIIRSETPFPLEVKLPLDLGNEGVGSTDYFHALASICATLQPAQIVEFGTFLGMGTLSMALNCDAQILTIDLPDGVNEDNVNTLNDIDVGLVAQSRMRTGSNFKGKVFEKRITQLRCDSRALDLRQHCGGADLILIDGGHSSECISADTDNAFRVIRPGGVIVWDDYSWMYPDVVKYLNELLESRTLHQIQGTYLVVWINEEVTGSRSPV